VLISTIDVFKNPVGTDEDIPLTTDGLHAYGINRLAFEQMAAEIVRNCHIVRLPALFGRNIKKNFIFDLINVIPSMLTEHKYNELSSQSPMIARMYSKQRNGFYACICAESGRPELRAEFERIGFSAVNFTDSRAEYQFYNLAYLCEHIQIVIKNNIPLIHLATEPLSSAEIYHALKNSEFVNKIAEQPPKYDFRTKYAELFGGKDGYLFGKEHVLREICEFVEGNAK
jgi:hypothetical protein